MAPLEKVAKYLATLRAKHTGRQTDSEGVGVGVGEDRGPHTLGYLGCGHSYALCAQTRRERARASVIHAIRTAQLAIKMA